jgi:hypothetical protein
MTTPEQIVDGVIAARGDHEGFMQALGGLRRQPWMDDWQLAERIVRVVQERGRQGLLHEQERCALIGHFVAGSDQARATTTPRFLEVDEAMGRIEREHAGEDGTLHLDEPLPELRELNVKWQRLVAASMEFREPMPELASIRSRGGAEPRGEQLAKAPSRRAEVSTESVPGVSVSLCEQSHPLELCRGAGVNSWVRHVHAA